MVMNVLPSAPGVATRWCLLRARPCRTPRTHASRYPPGKQLADHDVLHWFPSNRRENPVARDRTRRSHQRSHRLRRAVASSHGRNARWHRQHPNRASHPHRRTGHGRRLGEARGGQPDWLVQGPHGPRDDRGRRASGSSEARSARRRVHGRQHGQLARLRLCGEGLPAAHRHVRCLRRREAAHDGSVRRAARGAAEPRRHHSRADPAHARTSR